MDGLLEGHELKSTIVTAYRLQKMMEDELLKDAFDSTRCNADVDVITYFKLKKNSLGELELEFNNGNYEELKNLTLIGFRLEFPIFK